MSVIIKSKIREKLGGLNLGEDLVPELERQVEEILKKAAERAKGNFRRTVYARDL
jgi:histone H3/H4